MSTPGGAHHGFPHHDWADADGLIVPDPVLARTEYFRNDPDSHSRRLRDWHRVLWTKPLPDGTTLDLVPYDHGLVDRDRDMFLKSDTAVPTWELQQEVQPFRDAVQERLRQAGRGSIHDVGWRLYDMGAMVLFPGRQVDGQRTINQDKGWLRYSIADRLDLTVECIRLYYGFLRDLDPSDQDAAKLPDGHQRINPLAPTLHRYQSFFALFGTFDHYVQFWLLQDLVTTSPSGTTVNFFGRGSSEAGHDFMTTGALPTDAEEYEAYLLAADDFVVMRNQRMAREVAALGHRACTQCLSTH
jgi:hypothetical protein